MLQGVSAREIAVSGLKANRTRINTIANNLANVNTTRTPDGGPFRRQMVILMGKELGVDARPKSLGVQVKEIAEDTAPFRLVYDPAHPDANPEGYVEYPNVNLAFEMVDLVSAQRAYDANVAVIRASSQMGQRAMEIIQR